MNKFEINKRHVGILLFSSLLIVICSKLPIDAYTKQLICPFIILLGSYLILLKDGYDTYSKAYILLIPIVLILISNFVLPIDTSNRILNILALPILSSIFLYSFTNSNYRICDQALGWFFKLFPKGLFENLKYLKFEKDAQDNPVFHILVGCGIGGVLGFIILNLLMSADDYFGAFIKNLVNFVDFNSILLLVSSFLVLFSVFVNIILRRNEEIEETEYVECSESMIVTVLSIVNVVFVLFLISEISRITTNFLQLPIQYTYSSYAREGFFQLLFVTLINFIIILFLFYKTKILKNSKLIQRLILILITFSVLLILNSYYRMFLYIGNYGFTVLRLQVILFLAMELILFSILTKKLIVGLKYRDAIVYFVTIISFYIVNLYFCNDTFISIL